MAKIDTILDKVGHIMARHLMTQKIAMSLMPPQGPNFWR